MLRIAGYVIMTFMATVQALKILRRVEQGRKLELLTHKEIHHAIVIPIYN